MSTLPRPGLIGLQIRLALAVIVGLQLLDALVNPTDYWDGYTDPMAAWPLFLTLILLTSWVVNELVQRAWKFWPTAVMLAGAGLAMLVGSTQGDAFGPPFGVFVWAWSLIFSGLLAPAFLLAVILRTPGCEMRSYKHLWVKLRGGDAEAVACPGWIDRFDRVRIFGR